MSSQKLINLLMVVVGVFIIYVVGNTLYKQAFKDAGTSVPAAQQPTKSYTPYSEDPKQKENAQKIKEFQAQNTPEPLDDSNIEPEGDSLGNDLTIENIYELLSKNVPQKQYAIISLKLKNILENKMQPLATSVKALDAKGKATYFTKNKSDIDKYFGITDENEFIAFADSLKFMNTKVARAVIDTNTIKITQSKLTFDMDVLTESGNEQIYTIDCYAFKKTANQGTPYVSILKK